MNDTCLFCDNYWEQGDMAIVIGVVTSDRKGHLEFVHRECAMQNVLGNSETVRILARERAVARK